MKKKTMKIGPPYAYGAPKWGARRIFFLEHNVWEPKGWLMPPFKDTRQQPKSAAFRLIEERNAAKRIAERGNV